MASLLELHRAGFSEDEIALWYNEKKLELDQAGFNRVKQSKYFDIPYEPKNSLINGLIGNKDFENTIKPDDKNLSPEKLTEKNNEETLQVDVNNDELQKKQLEVYDQFLNDQIVKSIQKKDEIPYNWTGLEKLAFINRNKHNYDIDKDIYDVDGKPIDKTYYSEFKLNEDIINRFSTHSYNTLHTLLNNSNVEKQDQGVSVFLINQALKHYAKVLSGNESWGARSYAWEDDTYGMYRMTKDQVQIGLNSYMDLLTNNGDPIPYWVGELKDDKDISGLTQDAQTALFLSYLSKQEGFDKNFKGLMRNDPNAIVKLLQEQFLIPRKIKSKEFNNISTRLSSNLDKKWEDSILDKVDKTSMQLPAFGKAMPDFISMSGDHLMGEGRKDAWERGGMQSVTELMWRLFWELQEAKKTGTKLDAVKLIEDFMTEGQRWDKRGMACIRSIAQDLIWFGLGGAFGMGQSAVLAVGTGGATAPLSPFIITGNAFALHGVLRYALIESYMADEADTFEGFWDLVFSETAAKVYGKDFALGAGVHLGGLIASKIVGPLLTKTGLKWTKPVFDLKTQKTKMKDYYSKWGTRINETAKTTGEINMLAILPSVIDTIVTREEYKPPTKDDFIDAAVIIFGLKTGKSGVTKSVPYVSRGVKKLYRIYANTGKTPKEVLKDVNRDQTILEDLNNPDVEIPYSYAVLRKKIQENWNKSTGKEEENKIQNISKPKFQKGNIVKLDAEGTKGKVTDIGYENGEHYYVIDGKLRLPEKTLSKFIPIKSPKTIWVDNTEFVNKRNNGEYNEKIEILQRDEQVYEKHKYNEVEALDFGSVKWLADSKQLVLSNSNMLFLIKHYMKLSSAVKDFSKQKLSLSDLVHKMIPKGTNEKPIKFLFTMEKDQKSNVEVPIIVGEVEGRFFHWDLQPYMALRKLISNKMTEVTAHLETEFSKYNVTGKKDSASAILVFRNDKGEMTGLLHSRSSNAKVTNEALKLKNEFGTQEKEFADVEYTSRARDVPKWENIQLKEGTNVFKGLEFYDIVKMISQLSEGDTPVAKNFRRLKKFGYAKPFGKFVYTEGKDGKSQIQLSKDLLAMAEKDYGKKLQLILMTLAHELGHYIDYLPEKTLARGNILGRIANLKKYMNKWIAGKEKGEGPFTEVELNKFRAEAEKTARANEKKNDKIIQEAGFNPKDILKIVTDAKAREYLPPAVYEAYARASTPLKKAMIADALKGLNHPEIQKVLSGKTTIKGVSREKIRFHYNEILRREVIKRGLIAKSDVMKELKALTQFMKPFNERADKKFTDYRYSPEELMADFMMAWILHPREVENFAPITMGMWTSYMKRKSDVSRIWKEIQQELNLPTDVRNANIIKERAVSMAKARTKMLEKAEKETDSQDAYDLTRRTVDSVWFTMINYYKKIMFDKERFKVEDRDNVELAIEKLIYGDTLIEAVQNKLWHRVFVPLRNAGIDRDIFGVYLQARWVALEKGPRRDVLNPAGIEYKKANEIIRLQEKATPKIKEVAEAFYKYREEVILPELEKSEVFDPVTLAIIKNNREYVTFVVEEYANWKNDSWVKTFIAKTKYGTAKDIMNPFEATILKDWQLLTIVQRHFAVNVIARFLNRYKPEIEKLNRKELNWKQGFKIAGKFKILKNIEERTIVPAKRVLVGEGTARTFKWIPTEKKDLTHYELIEWTERGETKAAYLGKEVAYGIKTMGRSDEVMGYINFAYGLNAPYRKMFTELNPTFWAYNIFRDVNRTVLNLPKTTYLDLLGGFENSFVKQMFKAWTPTYRYMFKRHKTIDKDIQTILDRRLVISMFSKYRSRAEGVGEGQIPSWATVDGGIRSLLLLMRKPNFKKLSDKEIETIIDQGYSLKRITDLTKAEREIAPLLRDTLINKFEAQMYAERWFSGKDSYIQPYYKLVTSAERMSRVFERTTKLAAFRHLNKLKKEGKIDWTDAQIDYAIRNWAGSPNFLRKGGGAALYNNVLLFGNAAKEEWRSVLEAKRYQNPYIWWMKYFGYAVAPQAMYYAAKVGMMGTAAHLYFNLIGNDTLANFYVIPLGLINDAGEFEFGMKVKEGQSTYKAVYLQFPKDEMIKMLGSAAYKGFNELYVNTNDDPYDNVWKKIINGALPALDENTPSFTPLFETIKNAAYITGWGKTAPKDAFTGMPIWPDHLQDAKGLFGVGQRALAYGKWLWNNSGGLMFYKFETYYDPYNLEGIILELEKQLKIPIAGTTIGRFLKVSNQGIPEKIWTALEEGRELDGHYHSLADTAVFKLMNGKELNDKEEDALIFNKNWLFRYQNALVYNYGSEFYRYLLTLQGDDWVNTIREISKIVDEIGYDLALEYIGIKK